jgi:hypothetical protein
MLKKIIGRLLRKHGMVGLLILIGDVAVKQTKSKKDDEVWAKVKELLETF